MQRNLILVIVVLAGCGPGPTIKDAGTDSGPPPHDAYVPDGGPDSGPDAGPEMVPVFRNAVAMDDATLAHEALRLMGAPEAGGSGSCTECHAVTRQNISHIWQLTMTAWHTCFANLTPDTPDAAASVVACLHNGSMYSASKLGIFATGANHDWFDYVFRHGAGANAASEFALFTGRVQMAPPPRTEWTQAEFDLVTEWFLRGTPMVETILPSLDGPGMCSSYVDGEVANIVADGAATGWGARNTEAGILMYGCAGATSPTDCLTDLPRPDELSIGHLWETPPGTHMRVLFRADYQSSYWTRSSADGRFVAHGGSPTPGVNASIIDLERGFVIDADAAYDPGFFPDNSGFMFQGTASGAAVCEQSVLSVGSPTHITFGEPGCTGTTAIGLYQHVGASLDGADYWAVNSLWSGDPGWDAVDPVVYVDPMAQVQFVHMLNGAGGFSVGSTFVEDAPWQGNAVISPSFRLMVTQLADASGAPLGYVLHRLDVTRNARGAVTAVNAPEIARYCTPGGKAAFSLDDRWLVTHHRVTDDDAIDLGFTGPSDPAFAPYRGVSNVYLIDLITGERTRVTNMQPGQNALFPHFRSDGWLYILIRTGGASEYVVATDAGLVLRPPGT